MHPDKTHTRYATIGVTVPESWLTDEGREPIDEGWGELERRLKQELRRCFSSISDITLHFDDWEEEADA